MLIIKKSVLTIFFLFAILVLGAQGVVGYLFLMDSGQKQKAELLFFCALVAMLFLLICLISIAIRASRQIKKLQRLLDKAGAGGQIFSSQYRPFGAFGNEVMTILRDMQNVGEKRLQRITFLNKALSELMANANDARLLLDSEGIIIRASMEFFSKFTTPSEQSTIYDSSVDRFSLEKPFSILAQAMAKTHNNLTASAERCIITFTPIFMNNAMPDGFFAVLQKNTIIDKMKEKVMDLGSGKETKENTNTPEKKEVEKKVNTSEEKIFTVQRLKNIFSRWKNSE